MKLDALMVAFATLAFILGVSFMCASLEEAYNQAHPAKVCK